jgi:predicted dinucleotide-binding enzyme
MNIAVIGAGEIGGTLIRQYSKAGHHVKMSNSSGPEKLKGLALETGASAVALTDLVTDVEVIVISIPLIGILKLSQTLLKKAQANAIVIDTCNYYPIRDGIIEEIENGMPESVWVTNRLQWPVIKAYNSILYRSLVNSGLPKGATSRIALPVAGDDTGAKQVVCGLVDNSGFDSLDYGSLGDSWKQQPGSPVYCTDLTLAQLKNSVHKARKELLAERRELGLKYILNHDPELWMDIVKHNRKIYEADVDV